MSFKQMLGQVVLVGAAAVGFFSLGNAINQFNEAAHPASEGVQYLQRQGYKNIRGGERNYFSSCGKEIFARAYTAADPSGKTDSHTVCFSPIFGPQPPPFGK